MLFSIPNILLKEQPVMRPDDGPDMYWALTLSGKISAQAALIFSLFLNDIVDNGFEYKWFWCSNDFLKFFTLKNQDALKFTD